MGKKSQPVETKADTSKNLTGRNQEDSSDYRDRSYKKYLETITKFRKTFHHVSHEDRIPKKAEFKLEETKESITKRAFSSLLTEQLRAPEYDMLQVAAIVDVEPIVARIHERIYSLFIKNGFTFISEVQKKSKPSSRGILTKLSEKLIEIQAFSGESFDETLLSIIKDWVDFSNVFLIKRRDDKLGKARAREGFPKGSPKISQYERVHPALVVPIVESGKVKSWAVYKTIDARKKSLKLNTIPGRKNQDLEIVPEHNMVHMHRFREAGYIFAKPRSENIEDDIRALRQIEENLHIYLIKHIFPLVHITVGTEKAPADYFEDGTSEVDYAFALVQDMPSEGLLITPERYSTKVLETSSGIDIKSYIDTFRSRLYIDMGVSPIDMGEMQGSSRSSSETVSTNLKDIVKAEQFEFSLQFGSKILVELLLDEKTEVKETLSVKLFFNEIDMLAKIKHENHIIDKYNNNLLTEDEAREEMGLPPLSKAEKKGTHFESHSLVLAKLKTNLGGDADSTVAEKNRPSNQHGKSPGPDPKKDDKDILEEIMTLFKDIEDPEILELIYRNTRKRYTES